MKRLLLFAQYCEAEFTIQKLNALPDLSSIAPILSEGLIPTVYTYPEGYVVLSSIGIGPAMLVVAKYAPLVDEILNFGFAGALKSRFPLGSIERVTSVGKYTPLLHTLDLHSQQLSNSIYPPFEFSETSPLVSLVSSDFPIHEPALCQELGQHHDLVDMEGYGIAFAANHFKKPCTLFKIVSDFCSPEGRALIRQNKRHFSQKLSEIVDNL